MDWEKYQNEALSYWKAANGAMTTKRLGNTVIYNLISLALENFLTSLLVKDLMLPQHSGIGSMLRELKKSHNVPESFFIDSRLVNRYMNFCSLEVMENIEPTNEDLHKMCSFMNQLKDWAENELFLIQETN